MSYLYGAYPYGIWILDNCNDRYHQGLEYRLLHTQHQNDIFSNLLNTFKINHFVLSWNNEVYASWDSI